MCASLFCCFGSALCFAKAVSAGGRHRSRAHVLGCLIFDGARNALCPVVLGVFLHAFTRIPTRVFFPLL